jgi:hypothetical protein
MIKVERKDGEGRVVETLRCDPADPKAMPELLGVFLPEFVKGKAEGDTFAVDAERPEHAQLVSEGVTKAGGTLA